MKAKLSKKNLIKYGMIETYDIAIPMKKILGENEHGEISIAITRDRNVPELCLILPNGFVYLNIESIEQLEEFEKCIAEYGPNF